jgi:hypothetical protein
MSERSGETHALVEKIAEAVIRLARIVDATFSTGTRRRKHRHVLELVGDNSDAKAAYQQLIRTLAVERRALTEAEWNTDWRPLIIRVVQGVTKVAVSDETVKHFLAWRLIPDTAASGGQRGQSDNIFRYPVVEPTVAVRMGSIHAAKGETHTATLVLETFFRTHHLKAMKPWLLGGRIGGDGLTATEQSRLKLHYVAMTRPARLLCLALRQDSLEPLEIETLRNRGWRVARVGTQGTQWSEAAERAE